MLRKRSALATTQWQLAQAVRHQDASWLGADVDPRRLAVYCRLVRNNTLGFIDRCYTETPAHVDAELWAEVKERFIREGRAHSPFFQDIAGEFLSFCRQESAFSPQVLELMDFEQAQLLAEVAIANVPQQALWNPQTVMQCSGTAQFREYEHDFITSDFQSFTPEATRVLVWRDSEFRIYHRVLAEWDFWLLTMLQEQAQSLEEVLQALSALTAEQPELVAFLQQIWARWAQFDVIYPA